MNPDTDWARCEGAPRDEPRDGCPHIAWSERQNAPHITDPRCREAMLEAQPRLVVKAQSKAFHLRGGKMLIPVGRNHGVCRGDRVVCVGRQAQLEGEITVIEGTGSIASFGLAPLFPVDAFVQIGQCMDCGARPPTGKGSCESCGWVPGEPFEQKEDVAEYLRREQRGLAL